MKNSTLMLAAIHDGEADDPTVSAALDALREEDGHSLIAAVLEVARVHTAHENAKQMARAAMMLRSGSPIRSALRSLIVVECPGADEDAGCTITLVEGTRWPHLAGERLDLPAPSSNRQQITVGAAWVVDRGELIRANLTRARAQRRAAKP